MMPKGTVLIVDDEPDFLDIIGKELSSRGYEVRLAHDGKEGLETAKKISADLFILDVHMPGLDGLQLKNSLNQDEATAQVPTIFLSASSDTSQKVESFHLGADDFVTKPFKMEELMARVDSTLMRHQRYIELSMTDKLTSLYNLHVYKKQAASLFDAAKRYGRNLSLAVLDIDNLKRINDTHGHKAGDFVIEKVAEAMKRVFRRPDILIRYGGDEFVILLPESSLEQASKAIGRFKEKLEEGPFAMEGLDGKIAVSVSCGLAGYDESLPDADALFALADQNLYKEKALKKSRRLPDPEMGENV